MRPLSSSSVRGTGRAALAKRWLCASGLIAAVIGGSTVLPWPAPAASSEAPADVLTSPAAKKKARHGASPAPTSAVVTSAAPSSTASATPTPAPTSTAIPATSAPATVSNSTAATGGSFAAATAPAADPLTGNPLSGDAFYGLNRGAAAAAAQPGASPEEAALLRELAQVPTATWLGAWSGDVASTVRQVVADARATGRVPVFVAYNIPGRDCGGHSTGGAGSVQGYADWVQGIATGIGTAEAVVVVEPDALAQLCGDPAERIGMLRSAVDVLERNPTTHTYLDAGHADWIDAATMAQRLRSAGATGADGFALNVSNFGTTAANVGYGQQVSALLDGAHFVIDTSRNGNGPGSDWCNPPGRAVGERPTGVTGQARVDAYLWVKTAGESDGACNGGPAAGTFWPSYAIGLMRAG